MTEVLASARYPPDMPSPDVLSGGAAPPFRNFSPGEDSDGLISASPSRSFDDGKFSVSVSVSPKNRRVRAPPSREEQNVNQSCGNGSSAQQLSVLALVLTTFRRSLVACRANREECPNMEISWPTNVRHVAHVTFDRYNGFLGLPVEFELEIPRRVPSASASVFGVSAESMQCSYDAKGNSVPTILLLMQERLYVQGGLKAEGIFRINPENSQEEHVRDQLNKGIVPDDIDVHCLAGLIKAWFRELPSGVLDSLTPDQVLNCNAEEEYVELVKFLPPTQVALLDWAINLMADVVQEEHHNKMNARNIAMVFAPNMTQMSDPLTALMHAVQVMNFLKTLILKTLREREEASMGHFPTHFCTDPSDEDGSDITGQTLGNCEVTDSAADDEQQSGSVEFSMDDYCHSIDDDSVNEIEEGFLIHYGGNDSPDEEALSMDSRVDDFSPSSNGDAELREKIRGRILNKFNEVSSFQLSKDASMFLTASEHEKPSASEGDSDTTSGTINNENMKNNAEDVRGDEKDHLHYMVQVNQAGMKSIGGGRVMDSIEQKTERVDAWC